VTQPSAKQQRRLPRWIGAPGVWLLVALTYLPSLTAAPGRMPTDTKLYLYLNPERLVADAPYSWDTRQFAGWVPHQTIAYLWPSGPWFVAFDKVGVPDWIAHRLWIGTILFLGGLGVRWAARHLGLTAVAATVAGAVYATSPYILPYVSRTSVMLLPWAAVGWLVGLTIRATTRTRWRDAALFALVVLTVGAVNAAALALIAPAPIVWLVHAVWQRTITWRTGVVTALKLGGLSLLVSLWWIVMLLVQGKHGADVLAFSETLDAVSHTSVSTEALRGLGYWLFYVRDPYAFTTSASIDYMGSVKVIVVSWMLLVVCLLGLALTRWSQRRYAALLVGVGIVLAVGVHPIDDPSPLMGPLRDSALGLALRSSTRALPLSTFGLALGAGALVTAVGAIRWRARYAVAPLVVLLAVLDLPAAFTGGYVDVALERDEDPPQAWTQAAAALDAGSSEYRVLQLPGSEFGAFRWGYTVDPPLPGLTDKPLVTRDLLPLGSPGAMDLLYALDNRVQAGTFEASSVAAVARLLGVDTVWVANDLAFDRFRTPRPETIADLFAAQPQGLGEPQPFGTPQVNVPDIAMLDEQQLSEPSIGTPLAPVELVPVDDPVSIVRAATDVVVLAGSGDGMVDAAAAGLLEGDEAVLYAGDLAGPPIDVGDGAVPEDALLIVTDSNRDRATQWRGSQDVVGMTERGGPTADATVDDIADERLAAVSSTDAQDQTVAALDGDLQVSASAYGEPFAYRPEDRPSMAVDGDPTTAWRVADRADPVGESIELSGTDGNLSLVQDQYAGSNRLITRVRIDAGPQVQTIDLDDRSLRPPGQPVVVTADVPVTITILAVTDRPEGTDSGPSAVGFAELGPVALEYTRLPTRPLDQLGTSRPVAIVMTRERTRATNRWRSDPDPVMRREFSLPVAREFDGTITLRLDNRAPDAQLDQLAGLADTVTSNRRLTGVPAAGGAAAFDGDPTTAWTTPFGQPIGSSVTLPATTGLTPGPLQIVQLADDQHSTITALALSSSTGSPVMLEVPPPDGDGRSAVQLPAEQLAAMSGPITVTITGLEPRFTTDRRYAEQVELPAAIVELGLPVPAPTVAPIPDCHQGLVQIDGTPIGVTFGADTAARLLAGEAVDVAPCDGAMQLAAGTHRITTTAGTQTGVDIDRITLRSGASDAVAVTSPTVTVERTRTERTATVAPCPTGCWLIMGEGYNDAWTASGPDGDLGTPVPISGGFNGWWLPPDTAERTIDMRWSPQRGLNIALLVALAGVLLCIGVAVVDRRTLPAAAEPRFDLDEPRFDLDEPARPRRSLAGTAAVMVVGSALVIQPVWGLVAVVPAAALLLVRRPRLLVLAAGVGAALLGVIMARRQWALRFFADAAWPVRFDDLHAAGLFVVVLVVAGSLFSDERGDRPQSVEQDTSVPSQAAPIE
jgi:arabinofuranan 3-O-arabinosyltransferase